MSLWEKYHLYIGKAIQHGRQVLNAGRSLTINGMSTWYFRSFFGMGMEFTACRSLNFINLTNFGLKIWKEDWNPLKNGAERWSWRCAGSEQDVRTFFHQNPSHDETGHVSTLDMDGFLLALWLGRDPRNQRVRRGRVSGWWICSISSLYNSCKFSKRAECGWLKNSANWVWLTARDPRTIGVFLCNYDNVDGFMPDMYINSFMMFHGVISQLINWGSFLKLDKILLFHKPR